MIRGATAAAIVLVCGALPLHAQSSSTRSSRPVEILLGVGTVVDRRDLPSESNPLRSVVAAGHLLGALEIRPRLTPIAIRTEATLSASSAKAWGLFAFTANAVVPLGGAKIRPYIVGGVGRYEVDEPSGVTRGWGGNLGVGVKPQIGAIAMFAEFRAHALAREALTVGIRW